MQVALDSMENEANNTIEEGIQSGGAREVSGNGTNQANGSEDAGENMASDGSSDGGIDESELESSSSDDSDDEFFDFDAMFPFCDDQVDHPKWNDSSDEESVSDNLDIPYDYDYEMAVEQMKESFVDESLKLLDVNTESPISLDVGPKFFTADVRCNSISRRTINRFLRLLRDSPKELVFEELKIRNFRIGKQALVRLESALASKNIISLEISCPNFRGTSLSVILEANTTIESLCLKRASFWNIEEAKRVSTAMSMHPSMKKISLNQCIFGGSFEGTDADEIFAAIFDGVKDKREFDLFGHDYYDCRYESKILKAIPTQLATNPRLETLNIVRACVGSWGHREKEEYEYPGGLIQALSKNTNLKCLSITDEYDISEKELLKSIFDTFSLNAVADSNHTCFISYDKKTLGSKIGWHKDLHNQSRGLIIKCKVLLALDAKSEGNLHTHYFNDVPYGLMPDILKLVQDVRDVNCGETKMDENALGLVSLKNVFEVMRSCVAPILWTSQKSTLLKRKREA